VTRKSGEAKQEHGLSFTFRLAIGPPKSRRLSLPKRKAPCRAVRRGNYLVNTIMACGNCHSPRDAEGKFIAAERSMAYGFYAGLKQKDLKDLIAYLRTVPPLD
jgi:hypothetical protein